MSYIFPISLYSVRVSGHIKFVRRILSSKILSNSAGDLTKACTLHEGKVLQEVGTFKSNFRVCHT